LVSSHLLGEVELLADDVVVVNRGRLVTSGQLVDLQETATLVRCSETERLQQLLAGASATVVRDSDVLTVRGMAIDEIGQRAFDAGIIVHELSPRAGSLEERFLQWTSNTEEVLEP
jgi:ABC-2 type transport system ATP-binding protein